MKFASAAYGWQLGSLHHEGESRLEEFGILVKGKHKVILILLIIK